MNLITDLHICISVYICLYLSISVYICLYLSISVYICLYLSISVFSIAHFSCNKTKKKRSNNVVVRRPPPRLLLGAAPRTPPSSEARLAAAVSPRRRPEAVQPVHPHSGHLQRNSPTIPPTSRRSGAEGARPAAVSTPAAAAASTRQGESFFAGAVAGGGRRRGGRRRRALARVRRTSQERADSARADAVDGRLSAEPARSRRAGGEPVSAATARAVADERGQRGDAKSLLPGLQVLRIAERVGLSSAV